MNFLENIITVEEESPHTPATMVTGKPQLTSLNADFQTDGYDVPASATGKWLIRHCPFNIATTVHNTLVPSNAASWWP